MFLHKILDLHPEHKATDEAYERKPGPPRSKAQVLSLPEHGPVPRPSRGPVRG